MMKQPKIITRLEMAQREVARLTAERDALAAALRGCANLTRNQEASPGTVAEVGRMVQQIADDFTHAIERARLTQAVVVAARVTLRTGMISSLRCSIDALDAHDNEVPRAEQE